MPVKWNACPLCGRKSWSVYCCGSCVREAAVLRAQPGTGRDQLTKHERHRRRFRAEPIVCRCDAGLSRGVWQVRSWCRELWAGPETAPGRHLAGARCAVQRLRQGQRQCSGKGYVGIMAYYGTGRCAWKPATGRAALMSTVEGQLRAPAGGSRGR